MSAQRTRREAAAGFRKRTAHECIAELEAGASALGDLAHAWSLRLPKPSALTGAEASALGLLRLVSELRCSVRAESPEVRAK
jgi:hypothetical protein